jgi:hypothetical protein
MRSLKRRAYADPVYLVARAALLATGPLCHECKVRPARVADHVPSLSEHRHVLGGGCTCVLLPHCWECSSSQGGRLRARQLDERLARIAGKQLEENELVVEPIGFGPDDRAWDVPWLDELRDVPPEGCWPRLMTPPHPRAEGSLGEAFAAFAAERMGGELRWWQRLAATRLLEVDGDGRLVWPAALVLTARQVGKSVLLRELCLWRLLQSERFAQPQTVVHVAKDRAIAAEIQRSARSWAAERPDEFPKVMSANGYELVEHASGGRWLIKSRAAVYGHSSSLVVVDEAWAVKASEVEDAIVPTLVETTSSQLLITSTANRQATSLVLGRRRAALELLDDPGAGDLLLEWSAPPDCDIQDPEMWRMGSPYWTPQRERLIAAAAERALAGDAEGDGDDPRMAVRGQWLNEWTWPQRHDGRGSPLLETGIWDALRTDQDCVGARWTVALEDHYGQGGALAAAGELADGSWLLAGWECSSRAEAAARAAELIDELPRVDLVVGATLQADPDVRAVALGASAGTTALTRQAVPLLRELAAQGRVHWDPADGSELAAAVERCRVVERQTGLVITGEGRSDLIRAAAWALLHQAQPKPQPAIY